MPQAPTPRRRKQAVMVVHGMGEQIPMTTLRSFVDSAWATDDALIDRDRPDSDTGAAPRTRNAIWAKPDRTYNSFELRRLTTESNTNLWRTDFYEYYWAHLMHGTSWAHVSAWIWGLLLRNPFTRVPKPVLLAWLLLWTLTLAILVVVAFQVFPALKAYFDPPVWLGWVVAGLTAITPFVTKAVMIDRFGDVARYVMPRPYNVARRQEIRQNGVELLERLINSRKYDRIIVAAHSLGTIVAYDIVSNCFARMNKTLDPKMDPATTQPERARLEKMIRVEVGLEDGEKLEDFTDRYQEQQAKVLAELNAQGNPWNVSDFITMGSPLTHAEFLIASDKGDLRALQERRVLATCPPTLEYRKEFDTRLFTYRSGWLRDIGSETDPQAPRFPHHGAVFGYTRWTNLYSPQSFVIKGDMISGPVADQFALEVDDRTARGAKDIAVLLEGFVTHNNYWNGDVRISSDKRGEVPQHIAELRRALDLNSP